MKIYISVANDSILTNDWCALSYQHLELINFKGIHIDFNDIA